MFILGLIFGFLLGTLWMKMPLDEKQDEINKLKNKILDLKDEKLYQDKILKNLKTNNKKIGGNNK